MNDQPTATTAAQPTEAEREHAANLLHLVLDGYANTLDVARALAEARAAGYAAGLAEGAERAADDASEAIALAVPVLVELLNSIEGDLGVARTALELLGRADA